MSAAQKLILAVMASLFFVGMASTDIYLSSLPSMAKEFNATPSEVNLTISIYNGGLAVFVLFASMFSERFGRKPVIIFSTALFSVATFLINFAPNIFSIILLRAIASVGVGFLVIVTREILKDVLDERHQLQANAIMLLGLVLSPAIAPIIGAYIASNFGWRGCFGFIAVLGALLSIIVLRILPETLKVKTQNLPSPKLFLQEYYGIAKNTYFIALTSVYISSNGAFYAFVGISSYMYICDFGLSQVEYSYAYAVIALAYLLGNQYLVFLNKQKMPYNAILGKGVYYTLFGSSAILCIAFFKAGFVVLFLITTASAIMRAAGAMINPTVQVLAINYFNEKGGKALALSMSIVFAVMGIAVGAVSLFEESPVAGLGLISLFFALIGVYGLKIVRKLAKEG